MKKRIAMVLLLMLSLSLTACQNGVDAVSSATREKPHFEAFTMKDVTSGQEVSQKAFQAHKVNLVLLWQSDCAPCLKELQGLKTFANKAPAEVGIFAIHLGDGSLGEARQELGGDFGKIVSLQASENFDQHISYLATRTPTLLIVDGQGKSLENRIVGCPEEGEKLVELFQQTSERYLK